VLLAAESLDAKNSGIGRVARLMAKVLDELAREEGLRVRAVSLSGRRSDSSEWPWVTACAGRRMEYVLRVQGRALLADAVLYDSLSMARAHFMGPARRRPALAWMHGIEVWEDARPAHIAVARRMDVLITNSDFTRRRAAALHAGLDRARVCWLGTESDAVPHIGQRPGGPPAALILSRIDERSYKGHHELIAAWPAVVQQVPGARLLIAGTGPGLEEIRRLAHSSPAAAGIELIGFVPAEQLAALWARTSVFAMPSRGEGFGLVYIEAMRHGLPVIASKQDAGQEVNVDGETGFNVDLERPTELVEALVVLLRDRHRAQTLGGAGQQRWRQHFTWGAFRSRFRAMLAEGIVPLTQIDVR
jgi:phosphatidylinositol alpha-1,6-mannosyltransferase